MTNGGDAPLDLRVSPGAPDAPLPLVYAGPAYASWSRRVLASVLDGAIGTGLAFFAFGDQSGMVPFMGVSFLTPDAPSLPATSWTQSGWVVGAVVLVVAMQAYLGATPGKLVIGIAVVREADARPIGLLRTIARWLAHLLDSIFFIGYLRPLWNARRQTFADSIMATVVLDTRRPRRHPWFASGDSSLDPGPPISWEAPSAPKWWRAATTICAAACATGVIFSFSPTPGYGPLVLSCGMTAPDHGPVGLSGGTLSAGSMTTTRLGVTRHASGWGARNTATWQWSTFLPVDRDVRLRASFARVDGTSARHYDYPVPEGSSLEATVSLPIDALNGLGDSWTWTQTILVDGVESPGCTASSPGAPL